MNCYKGGGGWSPKKKVKSKACVVKRKASGYTVSEETRCRMIKAQRARFGTDNKQPKIPKSRKHSEETKLRISEMRKGKKLSNRHRENIAKARTGKKHTEETKKKMSEKKKGYKHTEEAKRKMSETKRRKRDAARGEDESVDAEALYASFEKEG